ncbi:hypothetical protein D1R32_gp013 [Tunisvirus fontaine2]|uniref:Uncharacterized protein n=1 Tax=Tunisvirus fontaine2 TaxID=1421067 RepID=V9SDE7_9VIRU|nr:hypothetical protein D1R32_gp013 [Tunisvirus fontaine2]AHC54730.1 hypothetical protein TNS_ORF12 [Tunisvirus fontaine2]
MSIEFDKYRADFFRTLVRYHVLEKPENCGILEWLKTWKNPRKDQYLKLDVSELTKYDGLVQYLIHGYKSVEVEERRKEAKSCNNYAASEHESEMFHAQNVQKILRSLLPTKE